MSPGEDVRCGVNKGVVAVGVVNMPGVIVGNRGGLNSARWRVLDLLS